MKRRTIFWEAEKGGSGGGDPDPDEKPKPEAKEELKDEAPKPVPYDRFKEVVDANKELAQSVKALQEADKKRAEKEAEEEGKFKELYETEKVSRESLEATMLRKDVALEKELPADLVERLKGETREELETDADQLLELLVPKEGKGAGRGSSKKSQHEALDITSMTPAEIREKSSELLGQGAAKKD